MGKQGKTLSFDSLKNRISNLDKNTLYAVVAVVILAVFATTLYKIAKTDERMTYEQVLAQMDDAIVFEEESNEALEAFDEYQSQLTDAEQMQLDAQDYHEARNVQQLIINDINRLEDDVALSGGITTYEDLQRIKTLPVTNELDAAMIERRLRESGIKPDNALEREREKQLAELEREMQIADSLELDVFGNLVTESSE